MAGKHSGTSKHRAKSTSKHATPKTPAVGKHPEHARPKRIKKPKG